MTHLFDEWRVRDVRLRNRLGMSPMCQYSAIDGMANDWHLVHLGARAVGGAGLVVVEATAVEARGRISPGDLGIWSDGHIEPLARIARFVAGQDAVAGIQIAHAGRKASVSRPWEGDASLTAAEGAWETIAPSAIAFGNRVTHMPRAMAKADIETVQAAFRSAARRAREAGFKWLEFHGAHGYLAHSFLSPLANARTDEYGGSFENRIRFFLETVRAIRAEWPENLPLAARLSCTDWVEPEGWTLEDSIALARRAKDEGVDVIDCSSGGGVARVPIYSRASFQVPFADAIRREAKIATAAVGTITEPMQADEILRDGRADLVLFGRQALRDPFWAFHAAGTLGVETRDLLPQPYSYLGL